MLFRVRDTLWIKQSGSVTIWRLIHVPRCYGSTLGLKTFVYDLCCTYNKCFMFV